MSSNPVPIERRLQLAAGLRLQCRVAGDAALPALVLLHPSPRSSAMFEPWMQVLAPHFRVVAVDTPGYGGSDPLPVPPSGLQDYLGPLRELLLAVAGPRFFLYGSATGAQLAIAYALRHAADVQHLLLDNAAHFDDSERQPMLLRYFPDLTPQADGAHLLKAWAMCAQMAEFFPWYENNEAHRVAPGPPSAAEVQGALRELLAAGPAYAQAYRAAFEHEDAAHVQALKLPTTLLRWSGSILLKHIDRLLQFPLPACVQVLNTPAPLAARYQAMTAHLLALKAGLHERSSA